MDKWCGYNVCPIDYGFAIHARESLPPVIFTAHELELLKECSQNEFDVLEDYIFDQISPFATRRTFNSRFTSYGLKHKAEKAVGFYVPEVFFRIMAVHCGLAEKVVSKEWNKFRFLNDRLGPTNSIYRLSSDLWKLEKAYVPFGKGQTK